MVVNFKYMKILKLIVVFILYSPILFLSLFYSFVIRVSEKIGHIPKYNNPDPNNIGFDRHMVLIDRSADFLLVTLFFLLVAAIAMGFKKPLLGISSKHLLVSLILLVIVLFTFLSPLMEWYSD